MPDRDTIQTDISYNKMTGQGGWPTTILMTPEQKPFFAGTYFPKYSAGGRTGLLDILDSVSNKWRNDREKLIEAGERIALLLRKNDEDDQTGSHVNETVPLANSEIARSAIVNAKRHLEDIFDDRCGGFGRSPKFPAPHNLLFLMQFYRAENNERSIEMVEKTLQQMYRGGIYDHIGGGFCRYSTDRQWLVPHFEKMLYDNAFLVLAYTEAYELTEDELYMHITKETLDYVLREMTDEEGGFYSAQDADSDGVEGRYYLFRPEEILKVLGDDEGRRFCVNYDITEHGNFEGASIPNLLRNKNFDRCVKDFSELKKTLYEYRLNRMKLHKDDKILVSWNGMMIAAMAYPYKVFGDRKYLDAAVKAADFISGKLTRKDGSLRTRYRDYEAAGNGFLDDYAYYTWGLIELYDATYKTIYLQNALDNNSRMANEFWDEDRGGFHLTSNNSEKLIFRPKETYDGAIPSGNSAAAYNLARLARKMGSKNLEDLAEKQLAFLLRKMNSYPAGHSFSLYALSHFLST